VGGGGDSNNSRASPAYMLAAHELCARDRPAPFVLLSKRVLESLPGCPQSPGCPQEQWL
jgi:hypothetical protein